MAATPALWQGSTHPALSLEQAVAKLVRHTSSTRIELSNGIQLQVDSLQLESNSPVEDYTSYHQLDVGGGLQWHFWGLYDGHVGWACAATLNRALAVYVAHELQQVPKKGNDSVDAAIKKAFVRLDDEIMTSALDALNAPDGTLEHATVVSHLAPAVSGSCAILAILDPVSGTLRVAAVGDSRAVLGRPAGAKEPWTTLALSEDQGLDNEVERARVLAAHPNEPELINDKTGRMLGLPLARAFGDHRWKWHSDVVQKAYPRYYGPPPKPNTLTPPYLTAEPVIKTIMVEAGDALILASDGIWDNVSSENAVACVKAWTEAGNSRASLTGVSDAFAQSTFTKGKGKGPMGETWGWAWSPEDLVVEDANAAAHLAKNAFGGKRREQFLSVMSTQYPESRDARDDLTVHVLLFRGEPDQVVGP